MSEPVEVQPLGADLLGDLRELPERCDLDALLSPSQVEHWRNVQALVLAARLDPSLEDEENDPQTALERASAALWTWEAAALRRGGDNQPSVDDLAAAEEGC